MSAETPVVSAVIPAYQEAHRIAVTVQALSQALQTGYPEAFEIIVVDDGSPDGTSQAAAEAGARVMRLPRNCGKGGALTAGLRGARGDVLLLLDGDVGESASEAGALLRPVAEGSADMTVATFPPGSKAGFGFVMRLARWGLHRAGAAPMRAPLSGQRALSRTAWEQIGRLEAGFGLEMGLNLDAARLRLRVVEVPTQMTHRATGRDLHGFIHRGRQFRDILLALHRRGLLFSKAGERGDMGGRGSRRAAD